MAGVLDIFNGDAFGLVEMTDAINLLPYQPSRLGRLGLFTEKGVTTTAVAIERKGGILSLLPSKARGTGGVKRSAEKRDIRSLMCPHIPQHDTILADDIQGVRAFGKDSIAETVALKVSEKQQGMLQNHEVTEEWLRVGAIQGLIIDGDGSTVLYNLFNEFAGADGPLTEQVEDFTFSTVDGTYDVKISCMDVRRWMEDQMGGTVFSKIRGFAGDSWWDTMITHPSVKEAF